MACKWLSVHAYFPHIGDDPCKDSHGSPLTKAKARSKVPTKMGFQIWQQQEQSHFLNLPVSAGQEREEKGLCSSKFSEALHRLL